jgi:hypothetical protein
MTAAKLQDMIGKTFKEDVAMGTPMSESLVD